MPINKQVQAELDSLRERAERTRELLKEYGDAQPEAEDATPEAIEEFKMWDRNIRTMLKSLDRSCDRIEAILTVSEMRPDEQTT